MWIWEHHSWPGFTYDLPQLLPLLREAAFLQGDLYGSNKALELAEDKTLDTILANIIYSSDIEGKNRMPVLSDHHWLITLVFLRRSLIRRTNVRKVWWSQRWMQSIILVNRFLRLAF